MEELGLYRENLLPYPRAERIEEERFSPTIGDTLNYTDTYGRVFEAKVTKQTECSITVDVSFPYKAKEYVNEYEVEWKQIPNAKEKVMFSKLYVAEKTGKQFLKKGLFTPEGVLRDEIVYKQVGYCAKIYNHKGHKQTFKCIKNKENGCEK